MRVTPGPFPEGKRFAFSLFDDTDRTTLANGPPVYDLLGRLGLRTTKSVWPVKGKQRPRVGGITCADPEYLAWAQTLQAQGFEIALHNVTYHSSTRAEILHGLEVFCEQFGQSPKIQVNHAACQDGLYSGDACLTGVRRLVYNLLTRNRRHGRFLGHVEGSPYFWGDICRKQIRYVRSFVFPTINTLKACPFMPYHDPLTPYVNGWFASSDASDVEAFNRLMKEANQDSLEEEGGVCILYAHLGQHYAENGRPQKRFAQLLERLSRKNGWFVPVSELLDFLQGGGGPHTLMPAERVWLERRWLFQRVGTGVRRYARRLSGG
jgi:hypothetical protein